MFYFTSSLILHCLSHIASLVFIVLTYQSLCKNERNKAWLSWLSDSGVKYEAGIRVPFASVYSKTTWGCNFYWNFIDDTQSRMVLSVGIRALITPFLKLIVGTFELTITVSALGSRDYICLNVNPFNAPPSFSLLDGLSRRYWWTDVDARWRGHSPILTTTACCHVLHRNLRLRSHTEKI